METERKHLGLKLNKTQSARHMRLTADLMEALKHVSLSFAVVLIVLFAMGLAALINDTLFINGAFPASQHFHYAQSIVKFTLGLLFIIIFSNGIYRIAVLRRKLQNKRMQTAEASLREKEARFFEKVESDFRALASREVR